MGSCLHYLPSVELLDASLPEASQAKLAKPLMLQLKRRYFKKQGMAKSGVPPSQTLSPDDKATEGSVTEFRRAPKANTTRLPS
jgi:hypothetical protein